MTIPFTTNATPIRLLLVEDGPGDVRLLQEAFKDTTLDLQVHVAHDGIDAMEFLLRQGKHAASPRPSLILLDLNLPRKSGTAVLAEIKSHPSLKSIPVIVLSSSSSIEDVGRAYSLRANCYISKPMELEGFLSVIQWIESFWLSTVSLPLGELA